MADLSNRVGDFLCDFPAEMNNREIHERHEIIRMVHSHFRDFSAFRGSKEANSADVL